jgi:hypothetical protein
MYRERALEVNMRALAFKPVCFGGGSSLFCSSYEIKTNKKNLRNLAVARGGGGT